VEIPQVWVFFGFWEGFGVGRKTGPARKRKEEGVREPLPSRSGRKKGRISAGKKPAGGGGLRARGQRKGSAFLSLKEIKRVSLVLEGVGGPVRKGKEQRRHPLQLRQEERIHYYSEKGGEAKFLGRKEKVHCAGSITRESGSWTKRGERDGV